ncbi:ribosome-associated translation inhibitor RaiA [Actinotignum urinale]|uniref:ribosome hibernation-promoting factor, HPF/YfiA family n=1 Tax=Actinotignum urinale TaxID=190146 RepID=UPI002A7EA6A0|nr:ribosome-associated translation inhibitor RaiA [Actinotignum urinale]MDY5128585.1 ribosome-associated translation inhibitor RaiA [Actinotignum urinale]
MDIIVKGRNTEISDRFRTHLEDKLAKVEQFAPFAQSVEVEVQKENNPARAEASKKIELTVIDKGPVIRAEAAAADQYSALDLALGKLIERLRRTRDRKKAHGRGQKVAEPFNLTVDDLKVKEPEPVIEEDIVDEVHKPSVPGEAFEHQIGDSPVIVRDKLYETTPMSVDQALYEMEMVGHPFYLFIDEETKQPCAVYLRHGYTYGVIRLNVETK